MPDTILYDSAVRLFRNLAAPEASSTAADGAWPEPLWRAIEQAGDPNALAAGPDALWPTITDG